MVEHDVSSSNIAVNVYSHKENQFDVHIILHEVVLFS